MSDEEVESFEITDHDLATEFNPNRYRKNLSKNQQTYGIWAADSDEEEEERPRKGFGSSGSKAASSNYQGGVAFVSAGLQQPVKKDDKEKGDMEEEDEEKEEDQGPQISDTSSEEEVDFVITKTIMGKKTNPTFDMSNIAGMRRSMGASGSKGFEMYGKGAKLAMKMGFQPGKGLGKDLQGISAPIEAHKRKGRGAIGAYGKEVKTKVADSIIQTEESSNKTSIAQRGEPKWQKDGSKQKRNEKIEYQYVTAEDVLRQKNLMIRPDAGALSKVKVIDLTGPEQRILSGYHAIAGQQKPKDEWESENQQDSSTKFSLAKKSAFEMPELIYNINLLKDSCEQDILRNDKKSKYALDRKENLKEDVQHMRQTIDEETKLINNLENLMEEVKVLNETTSLDLDSAYISLGRLKRDHPEEWELYQLYNLVSAITIPLLKEKLKLWNPLEVPQMPYNLYQDWYHLLGNRGDIFEMIIWETWMPSIRLVIQNYWNVKDAESLLRVIETWKPLLANWIYSNLLDQLILPKINEGVENWDPLSDEVPIHAWIHPWLPHLGCKLEIVYPTIRKKLANALTNWHPCDVSAKKILAPWVSVFPKGSMDAFLMKNIIPKLHLAMQEFMIMPHFPQNLEQWNWVLDWIDMIPIQSIVHIFETVFFPNWLQFLVNWLNHMPNFEEVSRWYEWWRNQFPRELSADPTIQANLKKALEIMIRAAQNPGQPFDYSTIMAPPPPPPASIPPPPQVLAAEALANAMRMTVPQGIRDLIQMKCEELGLLFVPIPNRYYEAKQVYRCGNVLMYISGNVIYMNKDNMMWQPTSLNQLLSAASS